MFAYCGMIHNSQEMESASVTISTYELKKNGTHDGVTAIKKMCHFQVESG